MYKYLLDLDFDVTIVITKIDKVSNNLVKKSKDMCEKSFF
jgi:GTP-binding protein EngB required for normal cell division